MVVFQQTVDLRRSTVLPWKYIKVVLRGRQGSEVLLDIPGRRVGASIYLIRKMGRGELLGAGA